MVVAQVQFYLISPVAADSLAYSQIYSEWYVVDAFAATLRFSHGSCVLAVRLKVTSCAFIRKMIFIVFFSAYKTVNIIHEIVVSYDVLLCRLSSSKQNKVYLPESPFPHAEVCMHFKFQGAHALRTRSL